MIITVISLVLILIVAPKKGQTNILVYISICSLIGAFSVSSVKGLGIAIKELLEWKPVYKHPLVFVLLGCTCAFSDDRSTISTKHWTPLIHLLWLPFIMCCSHPWWWLAPPSYSKNGMAWMLMMSSGLWSGFFTIINGIFLLHAFKNINITWSDLTSTTQKEVLSANGSEDNTPY